MSESSERLEEAAQAEKNGDYEKAIEIYIEEDAQILADICKELIEERDA